MTDAMLVLDSYAILAWLGGELPAADDVQRLLDRAADESEALAMSQINVSEVFYIVAKMHGRQQTDVVRKNLQKLPVDFRSATDQRVEHAADIKAEHALAYANAFAAGLALEEDATLVTGDPEFEQLEGTAGLQVRWLDNGK